MMKTGLFLVGLLFALFVHADEWAHVSPADRLGGRMISAGYLRGKIVVLDCRDYGDSSPENQQAIRQLEILWQTYKTKPFIILGSHRGTDDSSQVAALLRRCGVSYPVYAGACLGDGQALSPLPENEDEAGALQVIDSTCARRLYCGNDPRAVGGVAGSALATLSAPVTVKQFSYLLDYEIGKLPGRAYLRLREFRKRFPTDAAAYDEAWKKLSKNASVKRLAKLGELARLVKDRNPADKKAKRLTPRIINNLIKKYEDLKAHENPFIAQEAKNALADLTWAKATLKKQR